jgi:hypothetical protein
MPDFLDPASWQPVANIFESEATQCRHPRLSGGPLRRGYDEAPQYPGRCGDATSHRYRSWRAGGARYPPTQELQLAIGHSADQAAPRHYRSRARPGHPYHRTISALKRNGGRHPCVLCWNCLSKRSFRSPSAGSWGTTLALGARALRGRTWIVMHGFQSVQNRSHKEHSRPNGSADHPSARCFLIHGRR